ncbi:urease accessory protein UreE [Thiomicrorhabdus sp.]|uniref:urease accessory protein UreE n=1 Tax=Thiomicrorhabdus sp. TaxID=2039724 RepID=UPI003564F771
MKEFTKIVNEDVPSNTPELVLTFKQREKSRLKVAMASGEEIGLFMPRGTVLKEGDVIASESGDLLKIVAAPETVSTVMTDDAHLLLRIAYHLGNRHVPLQVEPTWLRYAHDHVLDDMVRLLGGQVVVEEKPLQPESGAYGGGHNHGHSHSHSDEHQHHHHH